MGIDQYKDVEKGVEEKNGVAELKKPFLEEEQTRAYKAAECSEEEEDDDDESGGREKEKNNGSIGMVLLSTFVAVSGSFEFGSCVGYSAPTQSAIRKDLDLTLTQYSVFGSIITIGAMIGAVTSGKIADFFGRKGAMRMSAAFCITGWLAVYFSMEALLLDTGRFLTGFGIGIFSYVVPIFIAEIAPKNLRGGLTTLNQLMIVIGSSVAFLLGTVVTWRTLALTGVLPCIALLAGLFFIPESPRWLAKVGREREFQLSLRKLRGKNANVSAEAADIHANIASLHILPEARLLDLFQKKYIRCVIIGVGIMICQQDGGINGIGFYVSETFVAAGSSAKVGTIAYALIQIPITLLGALLMDKSGRKPLLMASAAGTCLGCLITGASFFLKDHNMWLNRVPLMAVSGVLIYIASFSFGTGSVPWIIMSEIFPIHIKGAAGSLTVLVNWLGAWAVSYTYNFLMSWSSTGTYMIYSVCCALTILFVTKVVPETKGKTLEEIQAFINP